jgi:hypothetical protein
MSLIAVLGLGNVALITLAAIIPVLMKERPVIIQLAA